MNVTVVLTKPHRHGGILRSPGEAISLPEGIAKWLIGQNVAVASTGVSEATKKAVRSSGTPGRRASCCGGRW